MARATLASIQDFLGGRRIAVIGVARDPRAWSRALFRALRAEGFEAIPVHPEAEDLDGLRCYRRVQEIQPPPDRALILLPDALAGPALDDCCAAGVPQVWLHRRAEDGLLATAQARGVRLVSGECLFMHLPGSGGVHRLHKRVRQWLGRMPS